MAEPKPVDGGDGKILGVTEESLGVDCSTDEEGSPTMSSCIGDLNP